MHTQLIIAYPSLARRVHRLEWPPYGRKEKSETQLWQNLGSDSKLLSTRNIPAEYPTTPEKHKIQVPVL
jgi:hypothetical protein